ncbi:phosphatidate cytidylyltransferase [Pendulispora albinea]|uniref:Phosphatidate cytidylyltransferase n=1 Tax=Pendulispora albinea TaxID=2741071 RepID=A0ABZ2M525_9BACT
MAVTKSNLAMRLLTAAVAVPVILYLLYGCPPIAFYCLAFPAAVIGSHELFAMTHPGDRVSQILGVLLSAASSLLVYFCGHDPRVLLTLLVAIPLLGPLLTLIRVGDISSAALRACAMGFGPIFVAVPMTMLAMLRRDMGDDGPGYVLVTLMFAWLADTGGYFAGRFLGKHKLYELVSPKKTIEGSIGGLLGSVAGALLASLWYLPAFPLAHSVPLALVASAFGQAGDLGESLLKRSTGVKDSGSLVPGHGGILDRIDALLLTSTIVYVYTMWVQR